MMKQLGIEGQLPALIPPYVVFGLPFQIFVMRGFFRTVPSELLEAARLDGATEWGNFWRILMPLSAPALATLFIIDALATWNELLIALVLISANESRTVPVGLLQFQGQFSSQYTAADGRRRDLDHADHPPLHLPAALHGRRSDGRRTQRVGSGIVNSGSHRTNRQDKSNSGTSSNSCCQGRMPATPLWMWNLAPSSVLGTACSAQKAFTMADGVYRIRLMPDSVGRWTYTTNSNVAELDGLHGEFECTPAAAGNHGPVHVHNQMHFAYADGTPYYPFGTTCYAWTHQGDALEEQTLETLAAAPFNKMRMCVFPKDYIYNANEPVYYPYQRSADGSRTDAL